MAHDMAMLAVGCPWPRAEVECGLEVQRRSVRPQYMAASAWHSAVLAAEILTKMSDSGQETSPMVVLAVFPHYVIA